MLKKIENILLSKSLSSRLILVSLMYISKNKTEKNIIITCNKNLFFGEIKIFKSDKKPTKKIKKRKTITIKLMLMNK